MKLGLPKEEIMPERDLNSNERVNSKITSLGSDIKQSGISEQDLSPRELLAVSTWNMTTKCTVSWNLFLVEPWLCLKLSTVISSAELWGQPRSRNSIAEVTDLFPLNFFLLIPSFFRCQSLTSDCRLALAKDPEYISAMIVLGQTLLQRDEPREAAEYLEGAISKVRTLLFYSSDLVSILSMCNSTMFISLFMRSFLIPYRYMQSPLLIFHQY